MRIAAFTMAYNEPVFLALWKAHYGQQLGLENLFCIDHGSDDGSTENIGISVLRLPRGKLDEDQRAAFVSRFHASLLTYYDVVIFTDCDEFLVPDPRLYAGLRDFVERKCVTVVTAVGVNVVHAPDQEAPIDLSRPFFSQRRFGRFHGSYCKTLISRMPITWGPGFHGCNFVQNVDMGLYLFHLKYMDLSYFRNTHKSRNAIQLSAGAIKQSHNHHWRQDSSVIEKEYFHPGTSGPDESDDAFSFYDDLKRCGYLSPKWLLKIDKNRRKPKFFNGPVRLIPARFATAIPSLAMNPPELILD